MAFSVAGRKGTYDAPAGRLHDQAVERRLDLTQLHGNVLTQRVVIAQVLCVHAAHRWFACLLVYLTLGKWPEEANDEPLRTL